ncbi:trypsin-like serine protease [Kitasatospora sp. NPDC048298]|uniref:trypsin-like serine protease n=1 Tax=Kitasatospora sp. NPDC048298 TaxID=3364049 RepID=UPI0037103805
MSRKSQARSLRAGVLVAAATAGTLSSFSPAGAVVGDPAADGSYAFTVRLAIGDNVRACTGALVDRYWVLTAASCFSDDPAQPQALAAGAPKWKTTATVGDRSVEIAELAPRQDRDLVLARLAAPVNGVAPIAVATTAPSAGETLRVPGYGRTKDEWIPNKLHTGAFSLDTVSPTGIGITGTGGAAICKGDTGAPAVREVNGRAAELVAVASRSWQGGCLGVPATETRTGAYDTRVDDLGGWIKQVRDGWWESVTANPPARSSVYDPARKITTVFAVDGNRHVVSSSSADGTTWSGWEQVAGNWEFASVPAALYNPATGGTELFAVGTDGVLSQTYWMPDGKGWREWYAQDLKPTPDRKFTGSPTAVYNPATKTAEVFATRANGVVAHSYYTPGMTAWSGWYDIDDWQFASSPTAVYNPATGGIELFVIGGDGVLSQTYWLPDGKPWRGWSTLHSEVKFTGSPTAAYNPVTRTAEVFATRTNGVVAHSYFTPGMGEWSGWYEIPGRQFAGSPTAVFDPATGGFELFAVDGGGILARTEWLPDGKPWRAWTSMGDWKFATGRFPAATFNATAGVMNLFATGRDDGALNYASYKADPGQTWGGWKTIGGKTMITG